MNDKTIKVMTYNMHKGFSAGNMSFNIHSMKDNIVNESPDLLFVQEILGKHIHKEKRHDTWPDQSQPDFIANGNWEHFSYCKHADYQAGHHGNAIFSKFPLFDIKHVTLSKFARSSRGMLYGVIYPNDDNKPVHLICVHFGILKSNRNMQIGNLVELLKEIEPSEPIILAGDFNDWRTEDTFHIEANFRFQEAYKNINGEYARTYPAIKPLLRNDRIYYRDLNLLSVDCLESKIWKNLSDHLPIVASFEIK